ncbi:MATE family efflux transporter [Acutalibacter sp. 1XD8-36]|nr:MATE family efflux transporter [Acutalibacter sp. 1XD8-36]
MSLSMKNSTVDMTQGPILKKLVVYSIPVVLSGILQLLFRTADLIVVGNFTGSDALAAVSASGPVSGLIITLFMGLSVGANVVAAQDMGAKRMADFQETVHTSIALSLVLGIFMTGLGMLYTDFLLRLLGTPEDILPQAKTYLWFIFLGVPGTIVYNFGAAILRAVGDTRRPMIFMLIAGVLNFALNLLLVAGFHMGVEGVAIATSLSETVSAALVLWVMLRSDAVYKLELKRLKIHKDKLVRIIKVGLPAGLQGSAFSISYLLVQSSINSLGATVMAAVTVAWSIDDFCYVSVNALGQAAASFAGQNYGAKEYGRIRQVYRYSMAMAAGILVVLGIGSYIFEPWLFRIFTGDPAVITVGKELMFLIGVFGFVNGTMGIPFNVVRGMGRSVFPMVSALICICVLRVVWVCTVFAWFHTVTALFLCFPVAKGLTSVTGILYYHHIMRKLENEPV